MAVTKQSKHIEVIQDLIVELKQYVDDFSAGIDPLLEVADEAARLESGAGSNSVEEAADPLASNSGSGRRNTSNGMRNIAKKRDSTSGVSKGTDASKGTDSRLASPTSAQNIGRKKSSFSSMSDAVTNAEKDDASLKHLTQATDVTVLAKDLVSSNPVGVGFDFIKLSPTRKYQLLCLFAKESIGQLHIMKDGDPENNRRGIKFWDSRIDNLRKSTKELFRRYQLMIDEKRNFYSFILGMFSIYSFPFAVMTGYFGMNFDNMRGTHLNSSCVLILSFVSS